MRHAIPHDYNTIDRGKMQEKSAGEIDRIFTMCTGEVNAGEVDKSLTMPTDWANGEKVLAEANFANVREMVELLRLYHFSGFLVAIVHCVRYCFADVVVWTREAVFN